MIKNNFISIFIFSVLTSCLTFAQNSLDTTITEDRVNQSDLKEDVLQSFGKGRRSDASHAVNRGMLATGLTPKFDESLEGRGIDDYWAMDYSHKRGREAYHGGIDIPAPQGTPILAVAKGVVVAKFMNENNPKGIELVLRHSPKDSGLPMWTYTQYTHLLEMPVFEIGQKINMGDVIGKTSNTGMSGKKTREKYGKKKKSKRKNRPEKVRRHALHLGAMYSSSKKYMNNEKMLVPVDAFWMDPNALYKKVPPFDSQSLKTLSEDEKQIPIPCMLESGEIMPNDTKVIWPYTCKKK